MHENKTSAHVPSGAWVVCAYCAKGVVARSRDKHCDSTPFFVERVFGTVISECKLSAATLAFSLFRFFKIRGCRSRTVILSRKAKEPRSFTSAFKRRILAKRIFRCHRTSRFRTSRRSLVFSTSIVTKVFLSEIKATSSSC